MRRATKKQEEKLNLPTITTSLEIDLLGLSRSTTQDLITMREATKLLDDSLVGFSKSETVLEHVLEGWLDHLIVFLGELAHTCRLVFYTL